MVTAKINAMVGTITDSMPELETSIRGIPSAYLPSTYFPWIAGSVYNWTLVTTGQFHILNDRIVIRCHDSTKLPATNGGIPDICLTWIID
jgi:hypothetical protein